jgi:hypothetical protein
VVKALQLLLMAISCCMALTGKSSSEVLGHLSLKKELLKNVSNPF